MTRGLICTDTAARAIADRIADIGEFELIAIDGDASLDGAALARAEVAFFSADAYPERADRFLDNLRCYVAGDALVNEVRSSR